MATPYILTIGIAIVLACLATGQENGIDKDQPVKDIHGGVKMGVVDSTCDDGKNNFEIDYNKRVLRRTCRCLGGDKERKNQMKTMKLLRARRGKQSRTEGVLAEETIIENHLQDCEPLQEPLHKCLNERIKYDSMLPMSGSHRPLWPKFGEYVYLPPQRWIHSLEHGAIVFLYDPCADVDQVNQLRTIAHACLNKHIITPNENLPEGYDFAVVSWGCKLLLSSIDERKIKSFMIQKALTAPETREGREGQYDVGLIEGMGLDMYEVNGDSICPMEPKSVPPSAAEESAAQGKQCRDILRDGGLMKSRLEHDRGRARNRQRKGRKGRKMKEFQKRMKDLEDAQRAQERGERKHMRI